MNDAFGRIYAGRTKAFDFSAMRREFETSGLFLERPVFGGIAGFDEEGAYYPTTVRAIKRRLDSELPVNFEWWTDNHWSVSCCIEPIERLRKEYYSVEALEWADKVPVLKALMRRFTRLCMEGTGRMLAIDLRKYPGDVDWDRLEWDDELPDVLVFRHEDGSCAGFDVLSKPFLPGYDLITRENPPEPNLWEIVERNRQSFGTYSENKL